MHILLCLWQRFNVQALHVLSMALMFIPHLCDPDVAFIRIGRDLCRSMVGFHSLAILP
jgi:hypothetical protein